MNEIDFKELGLNIFSYRIFSIYPDLELACKSAYDFVGTKFPGKKEPLIKEMFSAAFNAYKEAEKKDLNVRHEFIRGLCANAYLLYQVRYCSDSSLSAKVWLPMLQSITSFEESSNDIFVRREPDPQSVGKNAALMIFAARVLPSHLYAEVFEREVENEYV